VVSCRLVGAPFPLGRFSGVSRRAEIMFALREISYPMGGSRGLGGMVFVMDFVALPPGLTDSGVFWALRKKEKKGISVKKFPFFS